MAGVDMAGMVGEEERSKLSVYCKDLLSPHGAGHYLEQPVLAFGSCAPSQSKGGRLRSD